MATEKDIVIVYGGSGALGREIVNKFKAAHYYVISIDLFDNTAADASVTILKLDNWNEQSQEVLEKLSHLVQKGKSVSLICCVAGGWAGGNCASPEMIVNCDLMWKQSVWSSTISAQIASKYLREDGMLQLTGAIPALTGTPGMMGYGMAKAAVLQLTKSLASPGSGLSQSQSVVAILPMTLDTPNNRKFMADSDFSSWTKMDFVAEKIKSWLEDSKSRPKSGSFAKFITKQDITNIDFDN